MASHVDGHRGGSHDQELLERDKSVTGTAPLKCAATRRIRCHAAGNNGALCLWDEILAEPEHYTDKMWFTRVSHHAARAIAYELLFLPAASVTTLAKIIASRKRREAGGAMVSANGNR